MVFRQFPAMIRAGNAVTGYLNIVLAAFVVISVATLLLIAAARWVGVAMGAIAVRNDVQYEQQSEPKHAYPSG
jgi:hypothetical protein